MSREGNLKDRTECAPNNGYFFLPIYDKGGYTLQVMSSVKNCPKFQHIGQHILTFSEFLIIDFERSEMDIRTVSSENQF